MSDDVAEMSNKTFVAINIVLFNILGLFGNTNILIIIFKNPNLRTKSSYLQCALSFSHIICLLFELPNAILLFTGYELRRDQCFPLISVYVFFICAQTVIMLMIVIDLFIVVFMASMYRRIENSVYVSCMLILPIIYSLFVLIWGLVTMDDEVLVFCNPPLALVFDVRRFFSLSNVIINTVVLVLLVVLIIRFKHKGKKQIKETRRLMKRLKVSIIIFLFSWYLALLGVDMFVALGFTGNTLAFLQSNMVVPALLCYTQSFYVIMWRSAEYRNAFVSLWKNLALGSMCGINKILPGTNTMLPTTSSVVGTRRLSLKPEHKY